MTLLSRESIMKKLYTRVYFLPGKVGSSRKEENKIRNRMREKKILIIVSKLELIVFPFIKSG